MIHLDQGYKKQTPEGNALLLRVLVEEERLERISDEDLSEVPLSDAG